MPQLLDEHGAVVGKCDETCKTQDAGAVDKPVMDMRWQEYQTSMHRSGAPPPLPLGGRLVYSTHLTMYLIPWKDMMQTFGLREMQAWKRSSSRSGR